MRRNQYTTTSITRAQRRPALTQKRDDVVPEVMHEAAVSQNTSVLAGRDVRGRRRGGTQVDRGGVIGTEAYLRAKGHWIVVEGEAVAVWDNCAVGRLGGGAVVRDDGLRSAERSKDGPGREDRWERELHGS